MARGNSYSGFKRVRSGRQQSDSSHLARLRNLFGSETNSYDTGVGSHTSGYGKHGKHSGYGKHSGSGYGHSGYGGHSGGYGGHGHHSGYGKKKECCPLVVDPLTLAALLGSIAVATFFLNTLITMNISKKRRRRRTTEALEAQEAAGESTNTMAFIMDTLWSGKDEVS